MHKQNSTIHVLWMKLILPLHRGNLSDPVSLKVCVCFCQSTDVCDQILRVVARSSRLEELVLDNAALKRSEVTVAFCRVHKLIRVRDEAAR